VFIPRCKYLNWWHV